VRLTDAHGAIARVFAESPDLPDGFDRLRLLHRSAADVYLVEAAGSRYAAHVGMGGSLHLDRCRSALAGLTPLAEQGIPRALGWTSSDAGTVLVSTWVPGAELAPETLTPRTWQDLRRLLERLHTMPAWSEAEDCRLAAHMPQRFDALAKQVMLGLELAGMPVSGSRADRHVEAMAEHVERERVAFDAAPEVPIHGDLSRSNIRVDGTRAGLVDWADLTVGDYCFDLASLKFALDSVAPRQSAELLRGLCVRYRDRFDDGGLEARMRLHLAVPGLIATYLYATLPAACGLVRSWRVRTCFAHSEAQFARPVRLEQTEAGGLPAPTEHSAWHWQLLGMIRALRGAGQA
jgi:aminoglycoside phosphotransferase (APT) family kinase protein